MATIKKTLSCIGLSFALIGFTATANAGLKVCANYTSDINVACNGIQLNPIPKQGCVDIEGIGENIPWMGLTILFGGASEGACEFSSAQTGKLGTAKLKVYPFKDEGAITALDIDHSKIQVSGVTIGVPSSDIIITINTAN